MIHRGTYDGTIYYTTISFLPDRSEKNLCKMLIAILLLLSSGSLIIVVDIGVVIPKPRCDTKSRN